MRFRSSYWLLLIAVLFAASLGSAQTRVYVSNERSGDVSVIDTATNTVTATVTDVDASQGRVTGEARVRFSAGKFEIAGVRSPFSLMRTSLVRYGESNAYLTPAEAEGVGKTLALPGRLWTLAGKEPSS